MALVIPWWLQDDLLMTLAVCWCLLAPLASWLFGSEWSVSRFMSPSVWIVITLIMSWHFIQCHQVKMSAKLMTFLSSTGLLLISKYCRKTSFLGVLGQSTQKYIQYKVYRESPRKAHVSLSWYLLTWFALFESIKNIKV